MAGTARGIRLAAPGPGTRPLADRLKQAVFAILEPDLADARFLDLFAGSGAAGIEALSRGAAHAVFVEKDAGAIRVIGDNLRRTGAASTATVVRADALTWLDREGRGAGPFDLVFVDPPYADHAALVAALERLAPVLRPGARVVAKHFWRDRPPDRIRLLASERERRFGESAVTLYRHVPDETAGTARSDSAHPDAEEAR